MNNYISLKMLYCMALVLAAVVSIQAGQFAVTILMNHESPGVTKINGTYYVVAHADNLTKGIFPIHTSTDLMEWKSAGFAFDESNTPTWARKTKFWSPEIHQIGANFILYFAAENSTGSPEKIGVAIAPHPLGPYSSIDRPIVSVPDLISIHPTIINDEGKLYLVWSAYNAINAMQLHANGMSLISEQITTLLQPTLSWEKGAVWYPWHIQRGSYHYLLYNGDCNIGVARSSNVLGPYEKLPGPIIVSDENQACPRDVSVVKDWYDESYVIIYNVHGITGSSDVVMAFLSFSTDNWPYVTKLNN